MEREQLCSEPDLKGLPYKIELNEGGQIVMSPASIPTCYFSETHCIADGKPSETGAGFSGISCKNF